MSVSVFCPEPEQSLHIICKTARWFVDVEGGHELRMAALNGTKDFDETLLKFHDGEFNLEYHELMKQSWKNYRKYGNSEDKHLAEWALGKFDAGGFQIPICYNEHLPFNDFTGTNDWGFPAFCGDQHASESKAVMEWTGMGIGTDTYKNPKMSLLYEDRIPRVSLAYF